MRRRLGVLALSACTLSGCGVSANAPATATPTPHAAASPTTAPGPKTTRTSASAPFAIYSQEHVGKGVYQLINNFTYEFESVRADGVRSVCAGGAGCTDYILISVTAYSGNTQFPVSPKPFALTNASGTRFAPATPRQASPVVPPGSLLPTTVLQPDDDGDYTSGKLVFLVPPRAGRFSLTWHGYHVATFVKTAGGKLREAR
jgi:hypothetical protein